MIILPVKDHKAKLAARSGRNAAATMFLLMLALLSAAGCTPADDSARSATVREKETPAPALPFSETSKLFEIVPAESEALFQIDEIFNGEEKTVVGTAGQVSGQIAIDFDDPSTAAVGPIQIPAAAFVTDSSFRDRAITNRILLAGIYETITFTPTAINGLPPEVNMGETVEFEIIGDLTITTISRPVIFMVTVVPHSDSRLEGRATTTVMRSDFDLVVPSATGVAAVGEKVILELDFAAAVVE